VADGTLVGPPAENHRPPARVPLVPHRRLVAALAIVPVALTHDLTIAIAGITVAVAASMGANAAYYAVNVDIAPSRAATSLGIMDFAFAISGFLAPVMTGRVLDLRAVPSPTASC
jgi:MFS transporter, ACS family, hexuronate transporter